VLKAALVAVPLVSVTVPADKIVSINALNSATFTIGRKYGHKVVAIQNEAVGNGIAICAIAHNIASVDAAPQVADKTVRRQKFFEHARGYVSEEARVRVDPDQHVDLGVACGMKDCKRLVCKTDSVPPVALPPVQETNAQPRGGWGGRGSHTGFLDRTR